MDTSIFQVCMTVLVNLSFAWMAGVLSARLWLGGDRFDEATMRRLTLSTAMGLGIGACFVGTLLSLWQAAATMADVRLFDAGAALLVSFATTHYGIAGITSLVLVAVIGLLHLLTSGSRPGTLYHAAAVALLLSLAASRVSLGHAVETGPLSLAAAVELTHLLSMAVWTGSVLVAAWCVVPVLARGGASRASRLYLRALSHCATIALAGVLASGLYNAFRVLNTPNDLLTTQYGWVLTAKLCLVALAILLGGWNRFVGFPAAMMKDASNGGPSGFGRVLLVLRIESIALLLVLTAAAVLTANAPP